MFAKRVYGIDLGTTYSCISYVDDSGKPVVIPNAEGDLTTPSVVYFESKDNIVVGKPAKNSGRVYPDRVVSFVKRFMGNPDWTFPVDGRAWKPEEISALILRKIVGDASAAVGEPITDVVITVPAYFGNNERQATLNAGKMAGLEVKHIINEPSAAAISYGREGKPDRSVLVYDLGGGTFDVSLMTILDSGPQAEYVDGSHILGGKDWDDRITNHLAEKFISEHPDAGDPRDDPESMQELALSAEEAKKGLSRSEKWPMTVNHKGKRTRVELTRSVVEELTADLLEQTMKFTEGAIAEAARRNIPIDKLLLVGGSSKMPCVQRTLASRFGLEGLLFDPDQAVARGAAIEGRDILAKSLVFSEIESITGRKDFDIATVDPLTLDRAARAAAATAGTLLRLNPEKMIEASKRETIPVAARSFGVVAFDEHDQKRVFHLVHAQEKLPAEKMDTFFTRDAGARTLAVLVMESQTSKESSELDTNREICKGDLTDLPPNLPKGAPIEVTFKLLKDGTLEVTAVEPSSKRALTLRAQKIDGVMTDEEVATSTQLIKKKAVS